MKTTLLRRYRWHQFIVMMAGGLTAGISYHFNQPKVTVVGIVVFLFAACAAIVLNAIDETNETKRHEEAEREKYSD